MADVKQQPEFDAGHVPMTEEMDSVKRTIPPLVPVIIALMLVVAVVVIYLLAQHTPEPYGGSIIKAVLFPVHTESQQFGGMGITEMGVEKETHDMVVMLVQLQLKNTTPKRSLYIREISAVLGTENGESEDLAASGSDYDKLFEAYPSLVPYRDKPIAAETEVKTGQLISGVEIFGFQMPLKDFQKCKTLTVNITLFDRSVISLPLQPSQVQVLEPPTPPSKTKHKK